MRGFGYGYHLKQHGKYHSKLSINNNGNAYMVNPPVDCGGFKQLMSLLESKGAGHQAEFLRSNFNTCEEKAVTAFGSNQPALPVLIIRGLNFAIAMSRWAMSGMARRNQEEISERLAICQICPHFSDNHCKVCGCPCVEKNQLLNKLALTSESCPLGKWK